MCLVVFLLVLYQDFTHQIHGARKGHSGLQLGRMKQNNLINQIKVQGDQIDIEVKRGKRYEEVYMKCFGKMKFPVQRCRNVAFPIHHSPSVLKHTWCACPKVYTLHPAQKRSIKPKHWSSQRRWCDGGWSLIYSLDTLLLDKCVYGYLWCIIKEDVLILDKHRHTRTTALDLIPWQVWFIPRRHTHPSTPLFWCLWRMINVWDYTCLSRTTSMIKSQSLI